MCVEINPKFPRLPAGAEGTREGSLLDRVGRTATRPGRRLARRWLSRPSADLGEIEARHDTVDALAATPAVLDSLANLRSLPDWERLFPRACAALQRILKMTRGAAVATAADPGGGGCGAGAGPEWLQGSLLEGLVTEDLVHLDDGESDPDGGESGESGGEDGVDPRALDLSRAAFEPVHQLIWALCGLIDCAQYLHETLGPDVCQALPPLRAFVHTAHCGAPVLTQLRAVFTPAQEAEAGASTGSEFAPAPGVSAELDAAQEHVSRARYRLDAAFKARDGRMTQCTF